MLFELRCCERFEKKNKIKKKRKLVLQNSRVKLAQKDIFEKYRKTVYVSVRRYPRTHNSLQIDKYYINQTKQKYDIKKVTLYLVYLLSDLESILPNILFVYFPTRMKARLSTERPRN